ncbi:hypothetical protein [Actinomadura parmotrematis]|uniref:Uncharacterized protein n=1 Tax=Actinomadura parmotrematis TaxID=2864039 RepID=A0ABS7G3I7_9ACTN|nr:hypothetical protein [Actinomadura parmotrematis]MBW8487282.1 hypothetical protein [Actinomadura parmotrematis]
MTPRPTAADVKNLPAAVDLVTAGRAPGIGHTRAHKLAQTGDRTRAGDRPPSGGR